jgi:hypothetical protein
MHLNTTINLQVIVHKYIYELANHQRAEVVVVTEAKPILMSPRSPSTSTGCRPANCVAASACCDPWRSSTPATVASADPHDDASNCSGRLDPPRPTGPAAFRADNPAPPPTGFPESHFGRHLSTCRHDPRQVIGGSQSNARMMGAGLAGRRTEWPGRSSSLARRGSGRGVLARNGDEGEEESTVEQEQEQEEAAATEAMAPRPRWWWLWGVAGVSGRTSAFRRPLRVDRALERKQVWWSASANGPGFV